jgi:hypothetical protein
MSWSIEIDRALKSELKNGKQNTKKGRKYELEETRRVRNINERIGNIF